MGKAMRRKRVLAAPPLVAVVRVIAGLHVQIGPIGNKRTVDVVSCRWATICRPITCSTPALGRCLTRRCQAVIITAIYAATKSLICCRSKAIRRTAGRFMTTIPGTGCDGCYRPVGHGRAESSEVRGSSTG